MQHSTIEIIALDNSITAENLFEQISDLAYPAWLDSSDGDTSDGDNGRYHILSAAPQKLAHEGVKTDQQKQSTREDVFDNLKHTLASFVTRKSMPGIPFQGGLIGYVSYDHALPAFGLDNADKPLLPEVFFGLYLWAIVVDKLNHTSQLIFHPDVNPQTRSDILNRFAGSRKTDKPAETATPFNLTNRFQPSVSKPDYLNNIQRIKNYICAGDVYQVNYAQHFSCGYQGTPFEAYKALRKAAPAPYSGYMQIGDKALLSQSPEQFIEIKNLHIRTSPIKGTAPRLQDERMDERSAQVLSNSEKDRAENLMIVDLMRNDLGRHCKAGSIQVSKLFKLKSYSNVHHLVSEISGELEAKTSPLDVLATSLPGGSITGAPKKRAIEIINELENSQRSFYCGSLGYISLCGNTDSNIGIRSLVADGSQLHCWGGGGIVADSDAEKEYEETLHKVGQLMTTLENQFLQTPVKTIAQAAMNTKSDRDCSR